MWNISVRVLLLFVPVLFANALNNACHTKGYGQVAIHACQEGSFSGPKVAMDASKFSGSYCECTLTTSREDSRDNVAFVDVIYANNIHRIRFSVDNITYNTTSENKLHNFNDDSIIVVVEMTGDSKLRTGNPCMIFRGRENANNNLTLSCLNGTDIDPRQSEKLNTSTTNSGMEKITTQFQRSTHRTSTFLTKQYSDGKVTSEVITTTKPPTSTNTESVKVTTNELELRSTILYEMNTTTSVTKDVTTQSNKLQEGVPTQSSGTKTVIIIVVVSVVCTAIIIVLITCYCKSNISSNQRRNRSPIKSDVNTIKPSKKDVYEVTENAMYVPMELLNEPNYTHGSTEHVYDQPDIDIIANHAHENEIKPLLQGQPASVHENDVKCTFEQSEGDDTDITAVADSVKHNRESQDHTTNEQKEQLYTQVDKIKSNNTTSASTEHIYDVSG